MWIAREHKSRYFVSVNFSGWTFTLVCVWCGSSRGEHEIVVVLFFTPYYVCVWMLFNHNRYPDASMCHSFPKHSYRHIHKHSFTADLISSNMPTVPHTHTHTHTHVSQHVFVLPAGLCHVIMYLFYLSASC